MLKVLLVDDEPYILQGLQLLLDWKEYGFEIAGTAADGHKALLFLEQNTVDLIIADIHMPELSGIELLEIIRKENISSASFVILSGFAEFSYAQKAIHYECCRYMLKPVEKEELISVLCEVKRDNEKTQIKKQLDSKMKSAYIARNLMALIHGRYDLMNLSSVMENIEENAIWRYIEITLDESLLSEKISDEQRRTYQSNVFQCCQNFLGKDAHYCLTDVTGDKKIYDIGIVYCNMMSENMELEEMEYFRKLLQQIESTQHVSVNMLIGKMVENIAEITQSYASVGTLRSLQNIHSRKRIRYYEEDKQHFHGLSGDVLENIEREIEEHFAENLTLKEMGEKYFVNSAYLGQIFRKKYGKSFKDYLNAYRIEKASVLLLGTNDRIYEIAEAVGYHDPDYFVDRFIAEKGCTPARYRKQTVR